MLTDLESKGVAIVGIAAQLPAGVSSEEDLDYTSFWDFLVNGKKAYEPLEKYLPEVVQNSRLTLPAQGAFLKNATSFDNIAFGISARDTRAMPHSSRRLLDVSFQALLDSGIQSRGQRIGCFMSGNRALQGGSAIDADGSFAWMSHSMANRISYALDLMGPSLHLDTACSSSLTALHLAVGALEKGDCTAALVGAAQINRDPFEWTTYVQGGVLAPDGECKPLSDDADGFGRGEGVVVIVIKSLHAARKDNDHIYSVILGSAINSTGSNMPLSVPNGIAQRQCIEEAYKRSGLNPRDADYVELHATGTAVGDPIEGNAHFSVFQDAEPGFTSVPFGTVKGNIGHLEVAAFLASLVKACLMFEHALIPPTVNFSNPTRAIAWNQLQVVVPTQPIALDCRSSSCRSLISLSGSGLGGATGHVVLQAPPILDKNGTRLSTAPVLFLVGGLSSSAVDQISRTALQLTDDASTVRQCAVTLSRRARQLPWRTYFMHSPGATIAPAALVPKERPSLVFVFSGQGPQNLQMGRQLFTEYPVFRNTILDLDDVYRRVKGVSLIESTGLFAIPGSQNTQPMITLTDFSWPATFTLSAIAMIQMALFDLLKSVGVEPDMMLGHSAGETASLYASGAGSKEMAMEIAIARGEAMTCTESLDVGMAMLACNADRAAELIARVTSGNDGILELSCINTPDSIAVSGTATLLDAIIASGQRNNIFAQRIRTMVPGHSSLMDCIQDDYLAKMEDIFARYPGLHSPRIPVLSTCRDDKLVGAFTPDYFWDNCRNTVRFSDAVSHSLKLSTSPPVFVEISCHAVLSSSILARGVPDNRVLCPMRRISHKKAPTAPSTEPAVFLDTLGRLSLQGVDSLDLTGLYGFSAFKSKFLDHPLTARVISPPKLLVSRHFRPTTNDNSGPLSSSNLGINKDTHPDLAGHVINGEPILPATAFVELLLESGANFLWDVEFVAILSLAGPIPLEVGLQRLNDTWAITTSIAGGAREQIHARGLMDKSSPNNAPLPIEFTETWGRLPLLDFGGFYSSLEPLASYGPRFQRVVRCHGGPLEAIAEIQGPAPDEILQRYLLHPAILDACLHVILHTDISKQYSKDVMYLPSGIEHFIFYRRTYGAGNWFSHIRLRRWTPDARYYDVVVTDSSGSPLCELRSLTVRKFTALPPLTVSRRFDLIFQPVEVHFDIHALATSFPERADKTEIQRLYTALNLLAVDMITKSLGQDLVVGQTDSRRRYLTFARRALEMPKATDLAPESTQTLREQWPHHFEITSRIASVHASVFDNSKRAVDVLYSDGLMAKFYSKSSQTSNVCLEATRAFSGVLESLRSSGKRAIKILEVGAGTGLLTHHLIDELKQNPDLLVEYTVTDISYALVADLARNISYGSVIPKAYDIGKSAGEQGIPLESYDMVVSLHVLHTAPDVEGCLRSLRNLLVRGGCLLTVELDGTDWAKKPGSVWFDCIFGSFPEWFGFSDGRQHCAVAPETWKQHLEAVDFVNVQTSVETGGSGRDFFFVAQKSHSFTPETSGPAIDARFIHRYEFGKEVDLQAQLSIYDTSARVAVYILALHGRDADAALGLCATLGRELPLWEVRLSIFESPIDISNPTPLLARHMAIFNSGETVLFFDRTGAAHISRVIISSSPHDFPGRHIETPTDPDYITVRVSHWAGMSVSYRGFVGEVVQSHHPRFSAGSFVGGVVEAASDNLVVHIDSVVPVVRNPSVDSAGKILAAIVVSLIKSSALKSRVAIAVEDQVLARVLEQSGSDIPIQLVLVDFRDTDASHRLDILLTDSSTYAQYHHLRRWIPQNGKVLLWDELLRTKILQDSLYIRRTLASIDPDLSIPANAHLSLSISESIPARRRAAPPFRRDRAYVLIGGIGGLGIDLAVWMYQHGARHLVLTSRRGIESLDPIDDALTLAKVSYLNGLDDLDLRFKKCDATNATEMSSLLNNFGVLVAGCFHMALVLSDAPFFKQTSDTFRALYDSKLLVLETFSAQVDIESLDFFVAFSSISGLLGVMGQSNYASACTALDGALAHYRNAFSLITPGISDAGYLDRSGSKHIHGKDALASISAEDLWVYLEDALRKLDTQPFNQYIPDLDWNSLDVHFPLPVACSHLLSPSSRRPLESTPPQHDDGEILVRVLELLEVSLDEFDATQPLTIYGLDSISAAKLSSFLRPYGSFSQLQLLGGATWAEVEAEIQRAAAAGASVERVAPDDRTTATAILLEIIGVNLSDFSPDISLSSYGLDSLGASRLTAALRPHMAVTQMQLMGQTSWAELLQLVELPREPFFAQPLVEICTGPGTPLIILPGGNGSMSLFSGLRRNFHGSLWAVQVTEKTPLDSFAGLVMFWRDQIRKKRPHGPYRFAAYSASTLFGVALTKLMEDADEEVLQLTFIDHCPALWTREQSEALLREKTVAEFCVLSDESVLNMLRNDPATGEEAFASYQAALNGLPDAPSTSRLEVQITRAVMTLIFEFLQQFYPRESPRSFSTFIAPFESWLGSVKSPFSLIIAEHGMVLSAPGGAWPDLGGDRLGKPARVNHILGVGHYGLFRDEGVARILDI